MEVKQRAEFKVPPGGFRGGVSAELAHFDKEYGRGIEV
jgi:hypothetical protein